MAEVEFQEAFTAAVANPQTRSHKWIMDQLFAPDRFPSTVVDYCFDKATDGGKTEIEPRRLRLAEELRKRLATIFARHGAVRVSPPLLAPKSRLHSAVAGPNAIHALDPSGTLLALPFDLRLGFARWVVKHKIHRLKRWDIASVLRPGPVPGSQPKEAEEVAFDVVTSGAAGNAAVATAEALSTLLALVREGGGWERLDGGRLCLRVNHSRLVSALLTHAGVRDPATLAATLGAMESAKGSAGRLSSLLSGVNKLPDSASHLISHFASLTGEIPAVFSQLRTLTHAVRRAGEAGGLGGQIKEARVELERVEKACESLGLALPLLVDLGLVVRPAEYASGVVFKLSCQQAESKKRRRGDGEDLLAVGGRYDALIEGMRKPAIEAEPPVPLLAVGFSLCLKPLLDLAWRGKTGKAFWSEEGLEVLICSTGRETVVLQEKLRLAGSFWAAGIRADFYHGQMQSCLEELEEHCKEAGIHFLLLVKLAANGAPALLLKRWTEREQEKRFIDQRVSGPEALATILGARQESSEAAAASGAGGGKTKDAEKALTQPQTSGDGDRGASTLTGPGCANVGNVKVTFLVGGGSRRLTGHNRKNYEANIGRVLGGLLGKLSPRVVVEVLATELRKEAVWSLAAGLSLRGSLALLRESVRGVASGLPNALKEALREVEEAVMDVAFRGQESCLDQSNIVLVLYAYHDDAYRVLT